MKLRIMCIFTTVLIAVGCYFAYRYYLDVIAPEQEIAAADSEQQELFEQIKPISASAQPTIVSGDLSAETSVSETATDLLEGAAEVNSSVVGWITIPGTHIDYPIAQGEDNEFYLYHGFDGKLNQKLGCPFLDYRCEPDFSGLNSIVYAHHMTRQRMFADVALFKDESFLQSHPTGTLTVHDTVHMVRFFAYLSVPSDSPVYQAEFANAEEKQKYLAYLKDTASYLQETEIDETSHLLLLSTCTFEYETARGVLAGVIVD